MTISLTNLISAISRERFESYKTDGVSDEIAVTRYLFNIEISKTFYPLINLLEVTLRNSIDASLAKFCGNANWENLLPLMPNEKKSLEEARAKLIRNRKPQTHGRIIAELNMGFWTALLGNRYRQSSFQAAIIKNAFPNCPKKRRAQKQLHMLLDNIRQTRNRIAHHERIIHWKNLPEKHAAILEFIGFLNADCKTIANSLDEFSTIFSAGTAKFEGNLKIIP